ncbi:hypothetical protein LK459_14325 [Gordonia otitidis]|uniref:hypothetical protein n=1 Tax=Gordonia otitidis TaxID=249058 RepID=UPI001D143766|nr:hypothetical protein [Gordonia otitidis]UEA57787.1 hypothetical protein LK459_14325 [Gordonia otitidis]
MSSSSRTLACRALASAPVTRQVAELYARSPAPHPDLAGNPDLAAGHSGVRTQL